MKKYLLSFALLALGAVSSFGSQNRIGYSSQFHAPSKKQIEARSHAAKASNPHDMYRRLNPGAPAAAAQSHARPAYAKRHTTASTALGFVSATQVDGGGITGWQALSGDFNGDGKKDVATLVQDTSNSTFSISVVLSNGDGTFQAAALTAVSSGDPIFVGDVNGDGKDDILQAHIGAPSSVDVWLSNGSGQFTAGSNFTVSTAALQGGILADVNGDGKLDITAVDSQAPGLVWTLLGNGDGTFQAATSVALAGVAPNQLVFADFNGDGQMDFAGLDTNSQVNVYLNTAGVFALAGSALTNVDSPSQYYACSLAAGDLNGDGKPEIVAANCQNNNLTIYVNDGSGNFAAGAYTASAASSTGNSDPNIYPVAATIADVNGDSKNDIVVSNVFSGDITVLLGNGDGTVTVPVVGNATGGFPATPAVVADFNGDGLADIMVTDDLLALSFMQGYGDGSFRAALDYYVPYTNPSLNSSLEAGLVATGDFNGDGIADFVIGNCCDSTVGVTVFLSRGDGSLQAGVNYGSGGTLEFVVVGDFSGDGKLDIAAADISNGDVQLFQGDGQGNFTVGGTYATDSGNGAPFGMVTGDFNHDNHLDIAVLNTNNNDVGVLMNDGTGAFLAPVTYALSNSGYSLAAGDVNGDGYTDLLVALSNGSGGVALLLADSTTPGTFMAETDVNLINNSFTYLNPTVITVGDLNGDGKMDFAVTIDDFTLYSGVYNQGVAVALGNGDGTFQTPILYSATAQSTANVSWQPPDPTFIQIADINGDGKQDLVYSNTSYGTVGVLFGNGDGTFGVASEYASGNGPGGSTYGLAVADMNGDGALDVVTADYGSGEITVLLNANGSATQPDFSVAVDTTTATVTAGSSAVYNLSLNGRNGYNGTVTFTCSGLPAKASCTFSPSSVAAVGNLTESTTLTISTTAATAYFVQPLRPNSSPVTPRFLASLSGLGFFGMVLAGSGKKRSRRQMRIILGLMLIVMTVTLVGCSGSPSSSTVTGGGGGTPGTPAGTYPVTVTSTGTGSNAPTHAMNLTLVVQ
ncbi:MAG TPA: VCBS repeat-containing protein [Candidatus Sulfotelmatobacter sp.]